MNYFYVQFQPMKTKTYQFDLVAPGYQVDSPVFYTFDFDNQWFNFSI